MEPRPFPTAAASSVSRAPRALRLERSPFDPAVMVRGVVAGLALAAIFVAIGVPLAAATPIDADLAAITRVDVTDVEGMGTVARFLDLLGNLAVVVVAAVIVAVGGRWRWGTWDLGRLLLVVLVGAHAVTGVVKLLTERARPGATLGGALDSAFPSGHAMRAAALYGLLAWLVLLLVRRRAVRLAVAALAVLAVVAGALARVASSAHWPTDVVAGVTVGMVWLVLSLQLLRPRLIRPPSAGSVPTDSSAAEGPGTAGREPDHREPGSR